jgi:DNA-3-methyladenine glycosylase
MITETEAYGGPNDEASHGFRGKTLRNRSFFLPYGHFYVYRSYGIHYCVNITTGHDDGGAPKTYAEGVLVRALLPLDGIKTMRRRRGKDQTFPASKLTAGPGMVTQALGISIEQDGLPLKNATNVWVTQPIKVFIKDDISITTRIGITKSKELNWRFRLKDMSSN